MATKTPRRTLEHEAQTDSKKLSKFFNIEGRSPGGGGSLGNDNENSILDYLSPHTTGQGRHWEIAADKIRGLMASFKKPVVDDEPARNGTPKFGGPSDVTSPFDHILHIYIIFGKSVDMQFIITICFRLVKESNLFLQVVFLTQTTTNTIKLN